MERHRKQILTSGSTFQLFPIVSIVKADQRLYRAMALERKQSDAIAQHEQKILRMKMEHDQHKAQLCQELRKYARKSCRELCDKACTTFPRELRDDIYEYLVSGHHQQSPHLFKIGFVGSSFLRELAEHIYRTKVFTFSNDHDSFATWIEETDSQGIKRSELVRKVKIWIMEYDLWGTYSIPRSRDGYGHKIKENLEKLQGALGSLFSLRKGSQILIRVVVNKAGRDGWTRNDSQRDQAFVKMLHTMFPFFNSLRDAGYSVTTVAENSVGTHCYEFSPMNDNFTINRYFAERKRVR